MRKVGGKARTLSSTVEGFFDGNFETRFLTTRGLLLGTRGGKSVSKISAINQVKKGRTLVVGIVGI